MTNEFDGTETDQAWAALTANDPALLAPDLEVDSLKASVLSEAIKVSPISKRSWLAPVAVAASVALFVGGGAGYTIAAQSSSDSANFVYAPISAPERGSVAGAQDSKMSSSSMWGWGGRAYLEADSSVADTSGVQVGYTFDASYIDRKTQLEKIADVFSVTGKITGGKSDGYFVGDKNYVKAVAQISGASWDLSQLVTWNYSDSSVNPVYCGGDMPMYDTKSSPTAGVASVDEATAEPAASECETPSGTLPSDEAALALAKEKFGALGFDSGAAAWSVVDNGGQWGFGTEMANAYKLVTAKVLINGIYTNQAWTMTVGPDNAILNANGFFAKFVATSEYKIVGAKTAIERSQNALWASLAAQEVYREGMVYPMEMGTNSNPSKVVRNQAGQPVLSANIDRVTIAKAEKSLIAWYLNDGSTILLPAYLLSESDANDSRQWLQIAIADEYVDFN
jgi:hypothetical protein